MNLTPTLIYRLVGLAVCLTIALFWIDHLLNIARLVGWVAGLVTGLVAVTITGYVMLCVWINGALLIGQIIGTSIRLYRMSGDD